MRRSSACKVSYFNISPASQSCACSPSAIQNSNRLMNENPSALSQCHLQLVNTLLLDFRKIGVVLDAARALDSSLLGNLPCASHRGNMIMEAELPTVSQLQVALLHTPSHHQLFLQPCCPGSLAAPSVQRRDFGPGCARIELASLCYSFPGFVSCHDAS